MKRLFIIFGALALALGVQAQKNQHSNYIGLNFGGGMNTLRYDPVDGKWNPKLGFLGEVKYMHFFGKHFGVGLGAQFNMANSQASYDFREVTKGLVHPANNLQYESRTGYFGWKESQQEMMLGVPIELLFRVPMGQRWFFLLGVGAQLDIPMKGDFKADEGSYEVRGYFPSTGVEYYTDLANGYDFRDYGFDSYNADEKGDIKNLKSIGISVIADLGINFAMSNHWGIYLGVYGGYGITNLIDEASSDPMLVAPNGTAQVNSYNGVVTSNQVDEVHLVNAGAKIGINFGWRCRAAQTDESKAPAQVVVYEKPKPVEPEVKPEPEPEVDEAALRAAEAAAAEARCNERRRNDPDMAMASANIDADIDEAEQFTLLASDAHGNNAVAAARAKAAEAKEANKNGQYCKAYDLFKEAYANIADAYTADARAYASRKHLEQANRAAASASTYAAAAHNGDLAGAMAAIRNTKLQAEIARDAQEVKPEPTEKSFDRASIRSMLNQINVAVLFDFGKTEPLIDPAADATITALCKAMAGDSRIQVTITGHTDNVGNPERNKEFGLRRAEALKAVMVKRGAPAESIETASKGQDEPVVDNETDEHRQQNRRAIITLK